MTRSLQDWLTHLETVHIEPIQLGLERLQSVSPRLLNNKIAPTIITVTGTNGKGTCVTWLSEIYRRAGYRVGHYMSPYLHSYSERICIDGKPVTEAKICQSFETIEQTRGDVNLSYFEFGTLAALYLFQQAPLDIVILEVGIGGRLDAVNIVDADIAVITTIGLDHCNYLGFTRDSVGHEKAGIFRSRQIAICGDADVPMSVREYADKVGAELFCQGEDFGARDATGRTQNAYTTRQVVKTLQYKWPVERDVIDHVIASVRLPGRFEVIAGDVTVVLDVAHNLQAITEMQRQLQALAPKGRCFAVFSMQNTKDIEAALKPVKSSFDHWFIAPLACPQALSKKQLEAALSISDISQFTAYADIANAYEAAQETAQSGDTIVVFGSFYTVAAAWYNAGTRIHY